MENYESIIVNKTQTGFRPQYGTEINILRIMERCDTLKNQIQDNIRGEKCALILFIDFKGAYNSVSHGFLSQRLKTLMENYPEDNVHKRRHWAHIVEKLYDNSSLATNVSNPVKIKNGVT